MLACRDREGRVREKKKKKDFVRPSATIGQEQEFRVRAKKGLK